MVRQTPACIALVLRDLPYDAMISAKWYLSNQPFLGVSHGYMLCTGFSLMMAPHLFPVPNWISSEKEVSSSGLRKKDIYFSLIYLFFNISFIKCYFFTFKMIEKIPFASDTFDFLGYSNWFNKNK